MDVHWSPRKRIKLGTQGEKELQDTNGASSSRDALVRVKHSPIKRDAKNSVKRVSSDFGKELDELLEQPDGAFNPTQVFIVDHEMELAMLKADIDHSSGSHVFQENRAKRSISQTLSGRETMPLTDTTNALYPEVVIHDTDSSRGKSGYTQGTAHLIDEFEGIDINELTAVIETAENHLLKHGAQVSTQECTQNSTQTRSSDMRLFTSRCVIEQIPVYAADSKGVGIRLREESSNRTRFVTLQGVWLSSYVEDPWQLQEGDVVHLLAANKTWEADHIVIGDSDTLFPDIIVFHPDCVISSTTLSASATCHRRSVIQNRVLAPAIGPAPTEQDDILRCLSPIIGNCVHEAVQAAAAVGDFSETYVMEAGERSMREFMLSSIWACGALPTSVISQLRARLASISKWGTAEWPKISKKLRGCETEIRPKSLGVTGKLDMDIEDCTGARSCIEIKTGKPHAIHVGQVVLYYLLQYVDKYGNPDTDAAAALPADISKEYILLYLPSKGDAETIRVKITARESQNIMRNRNLVAAHTVRKTLPSPISKKGDCQFCPTRTECSAMRLISAPEEEEDDKRFYSAVCFQKRTSTALCDKAAVVAYEKFWIEWIDAQPTVEALGGLSAVRRMRGNLLHMVAACLLKESGVHEGTEVAFFNWLPMLTLSGKHVHSIGKKSLCEYVSGYNPRTRAGRAVCIDSSLDEKDTALRLVAELVSPLLLQEERVLVCGPSHGSVDSVLSALQSVGLSEEILSRVTRLASKPEDVVESVRERMLLPENWLENIAEIEKTRLLFACTVKAVHQDILSRGDFNVAIVLGADRIPDAALWGVLLRARQVVLVGTSSSEEDDKIFFQRSIKAASVPVLRWQGPEQKTTDHDVVVLDD